MAINLAGGFSGALGGGLTGAGLGFGPGGALVGGLLGGLGGLFGGGGLSEEEKQARARLLSLGGAGFDPQQANQSDLRGQQLAQLDRLTALAEGRGPSLAAQQMRQGVNQAAASQQAMAGSAVGRGVGPGAAYRNAASTSAGMAQNMIGQTGMARAAEQLGALGQLSGTIQGARGQDEALGMFNAGQFNDSQMRNRALQLQALSQVYGGGAGAQAPGFGDQLLAGGANLYSLLGPRRGDQGGVPPGNQMTPGRTWWG